MLRKSCDPLVRRQDVVSYLLACLFLKPLVCLRLNHLLEETRVNSSNDVDQKLSGGSLLCIKVIMKVPLDIIVILGLFDKVIHAQLTVEGEYNSVDLVVLETTFFPSK